MYVQDSKGKTHKVTLIIEGAEARKCQIQPGCVQVNLNNATALTLPEHVWHSWRDGKTRVKVS
jgi:hypothetical protein